MNPSVILWTGQGFIFKGISLHDWGKNSDLQRLDYWKMHLQNSSARSFLEQD